MTETRDTFLSSIAAPGCFDPGWWEGSVDEEGVAYFDLAEDVGGEEGDGCGGAAVSVTVGSAVVAAPFVEVAADVFVADQVAEVSEDITHSYA